MMVYFPWNNQCPLIYMVNEYIKKHFEMFPLLTYINYLLDYCYPFCYSSLVKDPMNGDKRNCRLSKLNIELQAYALSGKHTWNICEEKKNWYSSWNNMTALQNIMTLALGLLPASVLCCLQINCQACLKIMSRAYTEMKIKNRKSTITEESLEGQWCLRDCSTLKNVVSFCKSREGIERVSLLETFSVKLISVHAPPSPRLRLCAVWATGRHKYP